MNCSRPDGKWKFCEMPEEQMRRPDGWGSDPLTEFLEAAQRNTYLVVNAHKGDVKRIRVGMDLFAAGALAYFSTRRKHGADDLRLVTFDITFPFLMASAQSLYAATTLAFSGQQNEAAKPLRGAVETALYGFHLHRSPDALNIWAERPLATALRGHAADDAKKRRTKAGAEFSASRILKELHTEDARLAALTTNLYERMIDEGGHFNIPVFEAHTRFTRLTNPDRRHVDYRLIGATQAERRQALRTVAEVISCALRVFEIVYREFWATAGVSERLLTFTRSIR